MSRLQCKKTYTGLALILILILSSSAVADVAMKGDYDGDGKDDVVLFLENQPFNWRIALSSTGFLTAFNFNWGMVGDIPLSGDFDGDHIMDPTVFRPSNRMVYVLKSTCNRTCYIQFVMPDAPL